MDGLLIFQRLSIQYSADKTYLIKNCAMITDIPFPWQYSTVNCVTQLYPQDWCIFAM